MVERLERTLARRGCRLRLDVARREQGGNVYARVTAGASVTGKKRAARWPLA